ncbi:hypothetical protein GCM10020000_41800 [Streptomyces olivoverticillatus]
MNPTSRCLLRIGLLAAGVATAATAGPAQASEAVVVARDGVRTTADHRHHVQYRDSFTVHQFGTVVGASLRNNADAKSVGCTADDACRSVALSFQIVTLSGDHVHLNAVNEGHAVNEHCTGCQTLAGAYQFVLSTAHPAALTQDTKRQLDDIHRRLDALGASRLPATQLKQRADALAAEVKALLSKPGATTVKGTRPEVTVHRHLDGWPGH